MIINGNPGGGVSFWSRHLLRDDTNEKVEVKEISGLLSEDLPSALREMQAIAAQSRSRGNFMYQANINPLEHEHLTPDQWKEAVDTLERNLGLEGHQRIVVEHVKHGRQHYHIVWNRVDVETLRVADMGGNWPIHTATARELEARFDLTPVPTHFTERNSALELYEIRAAERSGIDPKTLKAELTELWHQTDNGKAFKAAIEERGYILAQGDRRDFCVVDHAGDAHSLARRLDGVNTKDVRERMADIDRDQLPTVAEARLTQRERADDLRSVEGVDHSERTTAKGISDKGWTDTFDAKEIATPSPLMVVDVGTGVSNTLMGFISFFASSSAPPVQEFSTAAAMREIRQQRKALAAIENIRESVERGENLRASDIQNLTPSHIENIRLKGDDFVRELIASNERNRSIELDYGRTRER